MSKAEKRANERYWLEQSNIETQEKYAAYVEGYNQAEKDLTLTWEDIRDICRMWVESKTPFGITGEALSIEVLNRFNKQKGK